MTAMTGGCLCGRVRFTADVHSDEAYLCHCRMCQRASGAVALAMIGIAKDRVCWAVEPDWYRSSPIARRPFCATCGTTLGFAFDDSEMMDLTVASFDDPSRFRPVANYCSDTMNDAFADIADLPRKPVSEIESVTSRWIAATGAFPG